MLFRVVISLAAIKHVSAVNKWPAKLSLSTLGKCALTEVDDCYSTRRRQH